MTDGSRFARATLAGDLVGLTIDPAACDPDDTETLADLVLAAVRDATSNAQQQAAAQMGQLTGGFGEGLSGLGLGGPGGSDEDDDRPQGPAGFVH